jgi:predicted ATPase/class 3 adenylate cyclase
LNVQASAPFAAPSGVVTFLFTDIEGSTRRWEADAESMRAALAAHDDVLRAAIDGHGGFLFKHTGDGVCAVFASPSSAVDAAVAAQRTLELPVRMGIATGEAELRGSDYFGAVLNRAARVMSAGHGGQILLDGSTAGLLGGVDLQSLGDRRLRDIAKPVAIYQVRATSLRTEFPPLKTVDPKPGNLRPSSTSFVGRESELADVETALKAHRLVTLTGVGGVGKTRLALEVASRAAHDFPDGVWVIELAAVGDPDAVPEAVAAVLGITQQPGMSVADSVAATLEGRSRLLVFDNCEHVLDAAADMVEAILSRSETVRVLATSREGLRVADEQLWLVPSLEVDSSAATLFVERASAVASAISLASDADAVAEICRRLDGIPLAIELAASRMQSMTVAEVRDRLDDRFRLLVGSRRGLERHQTLRHAVQWSFDLLDNTETSLLARCSVFAGGFDLAATCGVTGAADDLATLDLLDALVRKSLLVTDRSSGRTRFSMLETIRQFAEEQLMAAGGADEARAAHARYFAGREADVLALWDSPRQDQAYKWFTLELANLRSAFRWAADHGDLDAAAAIASYATFIGFWVDQHEPIAWAEELVEPAKAVEHPRLAQLYVMAAQCFAVGRVEDAVGYAEADQAAIESGRFDRVPYEAEAWLGGAFVSNGHPERWVNLCRDMIARSPGSHTFTQACLVLALANAGAYDEAIAASEGLLAAADTASNPRVASWALLAYGWAYRDADPAAAYEVDRRALTLAQDSGNRWIESILAVNLSRIAATHGDPVDAFDFLTLAIRNYRDSGSVSLLRTPLAVLATLFDRLGHHEPAATLSEFAATPFTRAGLPEIDTAITHLREVLGDAAYEALARAGEVMTPASIATYAFDQIDQARSQELQ